MKEENNFFGEQEERPKINKISTEGFFSVDESAFGLMMTIIFSLCVTGLYFILSVFNIYSKYLLDFIITLLTEGAFVGAVLVAASVGRKDVFHATKLDVKFNPLAILLCLATSVVCLWGFAPITNLFMEMLYSFGYTSVTSEIQITNFAVYLFYVLTVCILPAVCEEFIFRGLIYNGLTKVSRIVAIFGSAFIFMIFHGSPDQTVHQFILGIILALCFEATGSLWVPILVHFFNNFIAVTLQFIISSAPAASGAVSSAESSSIAITIIQAIAFAIIGITIMSVIINGFKKLSKNKAGNSVAATDLSNSKPIDVEITRPESEPTEISANETIVSYGNTIQKGSFSKRSILIYSLSIAYLVFQWIIAAISGFGG